MKAATFARMAACTAAACAATLAPAGALAGSASASLSGLVFQLVDLNPSDGITPSMVFDSLTDAEPGMSYDQHTPDSYVYGYSEEYGVLYKPNAGGYTETRVATDALSSAAQVSQPGTQFQAVASWHLKYTLSPNTALITIMTAAVGVVPEGSYGHGRAQFTNELANGRRSFGALRTREDGLPDAAQGTLYGSVRSDATSLVGHFTMSARATASAPAAPALGAVSPVPEPAEWALLLAGLAVLGCVTLRRRVSGPALLRALSFAGLAMAGGQAAAAQHASLSIGSWEYRLIDLAPQDGIDPLLTYTPGGASLTSQIHYTPNDELKDTAGLPLSYSDRYGHASALVTADGMALSSQSSRQLLASGIQELLFTLTPNTLVEFTVLGHTELKVDKPTYAHTRVFMNLSLQSDHSFGAASDYTELRQSGARDFTLSGVLVSQDEAATGTLSLIGSTAVYAVPEPATWGMLLGGLGVVGMAAVRRPAAAP
jgi:hypothetical protein